MQFWLKTDEQSQISIPISIKEEHKYWATHCNMCIHIRMVSTSINSHSIETEATWHCSKSGS